MSSPAAASPSAGCRFPGQVISHAVWLYFRFPLSLRMVEEMQAARSIGIDEDVDGALRRRARTEMTDDNALYLDAWVDTPGNPFRRKTRTGAGSCIKR